MTDRPGFLEVLARVAPGTALRTAVERIIQQGNGALVVIGSGPEVEAVAHGGFTLRDSPFTPARLAELAKMDGAILLDEEGQKILRANAHLLPDHSIRTDETGARFRTSERMARMTDRPVLAISEERGQCFLFYGNRKHRLRTPSELLVRINQELQTLERFRRRVVEAEERLTRLEVNDQATLGDAITLLQRTELVRRIGDRVGRLAVDLGEEGHLASLQHADLMMGVKELQKVLARDYLQENGDRGAELLRVLEARPLEDLYDIDRLCTRLGLGDAGSAVRPMGHRLLAGMSGLPKLVRDALVEHFGDLGKILMASVAALGTVDGASETLARALRRYLDQVQRTYRDSAS
jgi:diadenylate cyclase